VKDFQLKRQKRGGGKLKLLEKKGNGKPNITRCVPNYLEEVDIPG